MKPSTGRWVSGSNFFGRKGELKVLKERIRGGNHVLLYGQRRMGKTSIARELCRQLQDEGWVSLFAEIEAATTPEDVITEMAEASTQGVFAPSARFYLEQEYSILIKDAGRHADEAIIVLEHDGYLEKEKTAIAFRSNC